MTYYRSDWPEVGLDAPLNARDIEDKDSGWSHEKEVSGAKLRWTASQNVFESALYGFPIWDICLMANDPKNHLLNEQLDNKSLHDIVYTETSQILNSPPWTDAYVSAKLVRGEPLHEALLKLDFTEVEHRRLYACEIGDLRGTPASQFDGSIRFCSLADIPPEQLSSYQEQIREICREGFHRGHTRHFADKFLSEKNPGVAYIVAAMGLNFDHVDPRHFLIAVDEKAARICGFTVIGKKSWLEENIRTQLLSAVSKAYRGRGIYRGLTDVLSRTFPPETRLLNVTHVENQKIQRAYQNSGRIHVADTVVLRRIFV